MFAMKGGSRVLPLLFLAVLLPATAQAHPHAFIEAELAFIFDDQGLAGIHQKWHMDTMLTAEILDLIQKTDNDPLTGAEKKAIEQQSFKLLKGYNYFTHVRIDGKPFKVQWATDFKVTMSDRKMTYDFVVPCHVKADLQSHTIMAAVFDDTFYTYVTYAAKGGSGIDPTDDPLYLNTAAPEAPEDYSRFAKSVKLEPYKGEVKVAGPVNLFNIRTTVQKEPSMAYYYEQIVPEAMTLKFHKR